jgi:hypothetical protein
MQASKDRLQDGWHSSRADEDDLLVWGCFPPRHARSAGAVGSGAARIVRNRSDGVIGHLPLPDCGTDGSLTNPNEKSFGNAEDNQRVLFDHGYGHAESPAGAPGRLFADPQAQNLCRNTAGRLR